MIYVLLSAQSLLLSLLFMWVLCDRLLIQEPIAYPCSTILVSLINFFGCRKFLFTDGEGDWFTQFLAYAGSMAGWRVAEYAVFILLVEGLSVHYLFALVAVSGIAFVGKFFWMRYVIFKR